MESGILDSWLKSDFLVEAINVLAYAGARRISRARRQRLTEKGRTLLILLGYQQIQDLLARLRNYAVSDGLTHVAICSKLWRDRSVSVFPRIIPRCPLTRTASLLHRLSSVSVQHMSSCSDGHAPIVLI